MIWVFTVSLPSTLTNSPLYSKQLEFGTTLDCIGIFLFVFGLVIETIADKQKFTYNSTRSSKLDMISVGLWRYSRHPNYFGEIALWWGIFLISLGSVASYSSQYTIWYGILSPLLTMFLLLLLSGIPFTEPKIDKAVLKEGTPEQKKVYTNYLNSTSPIIPLPPSFYSSLPVGVKKTVLFELSRYRYKGAQEPLIR